MTSGGEPLRFFDMVRILRAHGVDFVLIGGFSLAFHGHVRGIEHVDIVPDPAPQNLERLWAALRELRAEPRGLEDFRPELPPFDLASFLSGGSWFMQTDFGKLDVLQTLDGVPLAEQPWNVLRERAVEIELDEVGPPFLVASRDDLIMLKRASGRPQDLIDIEALRLAEGRDG